VKLAESIFGKTEKEKKEEKKKRIDEESFPRQSFHVVKGRFLNSRLV
jgi:hypothetical protein